MTKELMEKKNDLITQAEEVLNKAKAENRSLTEEEAQEIENLKKEVEGINRSIELEEEVRSMGNYKEKVEDEPKEEGEKLETRAVKVGNDTIQVREDEIKAFEKYIRGYINERDGELTPASGSGGAMIPTTIVDWVIRKVYDISPILDRSQKFNVKGKVAVPFYPADSNNITVAYAEEFTPLASSSGGFDTVVLEGYLAGALTKVSRSLINNTEFDIVAFVVNEMALQIARFIEKELLIGTPATLDPEAPAKVLGLSTLTNKVTASATNVITADEVVKLHDKIKDVFQTNAIWIMSPNTRTALRLLKDEMGRYLLQDDISLPFGVALLGKPVYVSDNMPDIGAGEDIIYYGDMKGLGTKFSENINIEVLRERYADEHAYGVIGWFEFDGKVIDEQQIAKLTMASM